MNNYENENKELLKYFISQHHRLKLIVEPEDEDNLNALIDYIGEGAQEIELVTTHLVDVLNLLPHNNYYTSIQPLSILKQGIKNIHLKIIFPEQFTKTQLEYCLLQKYEILSEYPNKELEKYYKPFYLPPKTFDKKIADKEIQWYQDYGSITIRVSDLKLFAAPDFQEELFCGGQYITENNKIIDLVPFNPIGFIALIDIRKNKYPLCYHCSVKNFCPKESLNQGFQTFGEVFIPRKEFCQIFKE